MKIASAGDSNNFLRVLRAVNVFLFCAFLGVLSSFGQPTPQGLRATFLAADGKTSDSKIVETLALYIPEAQSPTPFVPAGKYRVTWSGFLKADLRDDVSFEVEVNGAFKLDVGETTVLQAANTNGAWSAPVRLKKGLNAIRATFIPPFSGDGFVRVNVKSSDGLVGRLDPTHLSYTDSAESSHGQFLRSGLSSFLDHRCARCHETGVTNGTPDLAMDAPSFDGIGARLRRDWMARWIANPKAIRGDAHMPRIKLATDPENARAIATFLATLGRTKNDVAPAKLAPSEAQQAQAIFEKQHCDVCHFTERVGAPDSLKISLERVAEKFYPDALVAYIEQPDAHYQWTGMPRFRLSHSECDLLARWLLSRSHLVPPDSDATTPALVAQGKELVQTVGCLNCHSLDLANRFKTMPFARVDAAHGGCLGMKPTVNFDFDPMERAALQAWLSTGRESLTRNVPPAFAQRHFEQMRCGECHQKLDNVPPFVDLGAKLQPDWMSQFIGGQITNKPRPWIVSQMPAFPVYATNMAQGLAEQQGFAPRSTNTEPISKEIATAGENLIIPPPRGLGCVQCHANGATAPTLSDAPGINFAFVGRRLQRSYFQHWVRKPTAIDPHTKMPNFFTDDGKSPLKQYFNGDADMQIAAIWEYLRAKSE